MVLKNIMKLVRRNGGGKVEKEEEIFPVNAVKIQMMAEEIGKLTYGYDDIRKKVEAIRRKVYREEDKTNPADQTSKGEETSLALIAQLRPGDTLPPGILT